MKIYFAPLEGITNHVFRNMHHKHYGGIDKYFTPFISPAPYQKMKEKELKDVFPENNPDLYLVPQLMTNRACDFIETAHMLQDMGYRELNLNLGCPSGTVVAKRKGSGFLSELPELDRFFDEIFQDEMVVRGDLLISVKTRIGRFSPEEWEDIQAIYDRYPLYELIIHPRIQKDMYKNHPNRKVFRKACEKMQVTPVYNGDLFTLEDIREFAREFPQVDAVMLGRGLLRNPELGEQAQAYFKGEDLSSYPMPMNIDRFEQYERDLLNQYKQVLFGEKTVLFKMKDIWNSVMEGYPDYDKTKKKIRKCTRIAEYEDAVSEMLKAMRKEQKAGR